MGDDICPRPMCESRAFCSAPTPALLSGTLTDLGRLRRCLCPFLVAHCPGPPTLSATPGIQEGLREWGQEGEGKVASSDAKGHPRSGVREESTASGWTFVPPSDHGCQRDYQADREDAQAASRPPDVRSTPQPGTWYCPAAERPVIPLSLASVSTTVL